jgi:hypothetical protein
LNLKFFGDRFSDASFDVNEARTALQQVVKGWHEKDPRFLLLADLRPKGLHFGILASTEGRMQAV